MVSWSFKYCEFAFVNNNIFSKIPVIKNVIIYNIWHLYLYIVLVTNIFDFFAFISVLQVL